MNVGHLIQVSEAVKEVHLSTVSTNVDEDLQSSLPYDGGYSGGFLDGGKLAWRAHRSTLEIFNPKLGNRHAAWTFTPVGNEHLIITSVCGIGTGNITHVAIGVNMGDSKAQGMVAVLSLRRSRIIRAFVFPYHVTKICMVSGGEKVVDSTTLANELRPCQGLLAVATNCAELYLVDLCLDFGHDEITSDETCPALFSALAFPDSDPETTRRRATAMKKHPILCLTEHNKKDESIFCFYGPDRKVLHETPKADVYVTSLTYVPQLASLIIGYSFGSFQMYNLSLITIDCASPLEKNIPPVVAVSYQEPEDDPRSFVYLWISRSWSEIDYEDGKNKKADNCSFSLYAMSYEKKEWIEGHGLWYKGLSSMSGRYEFEPFGDINGKMVPSNRSVVLSTFTIQDATVLGDQGSTGSPISITSDEESDPVPDLSLTCFCWQTSFYHQKVLKTHYYVAVFDINQWYQAQMPSKLRLDDKELCPYISFCVLSDSSPTSTVNILAACPSKGTWSRYISRCVSVKDWYPSSLSFELQLITSESLLTLHCPSIQHKVLSSLVEQGPGAIVEPHEAQAACEYAGILIKDSCPANPTLEHVVQRENLLNVALDHQLLSFISNCITEFSDGKFCNVGCSLTLLSDWAWNKVFTLKSACDTLCLPLFDASLPVDNSSLNSLHQHLISLDHVRSIISSLATATASATDSYPRELEGRVEVVDLLQLHLKACLWFHQSGLLPEISAQTQQTGDIVFPFPADTLQQLYNKRIGELSEANSRCQLSEMLLIETLTEECGEPLKEIWKKDGRNGIYPPPSFHALLTMYLLPQIPVVTKHRIVQYLFLDLASLLSDNYSSVVDELVKFPSSFSLSPSIIKLTQAFWLIDHKDFQEGKAVLLHPLVEPEDITPKQHQTIVRALMYQNEEKSAMSYSEVREPPHLKAQHIQFYVNLLLANGKIREAFHLQRSRSDAASRQKLLHYLFLGCEELDRLESITHLPLTAEEEASFMTYLNNSKDPSAKDIMFTYSLQKSRLCGKYQTASEIEDPKIERAREALMQGFLTHLPNTESAKATRQSGLLIFKKPQPLSAFVRQPDSDRFNASTRDVTKSLPPAFTPFRSHNQRRQEWRNNAAIENDSVLDTSTQLETSHIVIPSIKNTPIGRGLNQSITHTNFRNTFTQMEFSPVRSPKQPTQSDVVRQLEDIIRRSHNALEKQGLILNETPTGKISADVLSMLRTPPPSVTKFNISMASEAYPDTPQSILKIRGRGRLNSGSDTPLSSKLKFLHSLNNRGSDESFSSHVGFTPKQLRFQLPPGETPTPPSSHKDQDTDDSSSPPIRGPAFQQLDFGASDYSPRNVCDSGHTKITSTVLSPTEQSYTEISYPDESVDDPEDRFEGTEIRKIHTGPDKFNSVLTDDSFHSIENESPEKATQNSPSKSITDESMEELAAYPSPRRSPRHIRTASHSSEDSPLKSSTPFIEKQMVGLLPRQSSPLHPTECSFLEPSSASVANEDELVLTFSESESEKSPPSKASLIKPAKVSPTSIPILKFSDSEGEPSPLVDNAECEESRSKANTLAECSDYVLQFSESEDEGNVTEENSLTTESCSNKNAPQRTPTQEDEIYGHSVPNELTVHSLGKSHKHSPSPQRTSPKTVQISTTPKHNQSPKKASPERVPISISPEPNQSPKRASPRNKEISTPSARNESSKTLSPKNLEMHTPAKTDELHVRRSNRLSATPTRTGNLMTPILATPPRRKRKASELSTDTAEPIAVSSSKKSRKSVNISPSKSPISTQAQKQESNISFPLDPIERSNLTNPDEQSVLEPPTPFRTSPRRVSKVKTPESTERIEESPKRTRKSVTIEAMGQIPATPRRTRRSISVEPTEQVEATPRRTRRSVSVEPTEQVEATPRRTRRSVSVEPTEQVEATPRRTRRSVSVEPTEQVEATPRRTRTSVSVEPTEQVKATPRRTRRVSNVVPESVSKESSKSTKTGKNIRKSTISVGPTVEDIFSEPTESMEEKPGRSTRRMANEEATPVKETSRKGKRASSVEPTKGITPTPRKGRRAGSVEPTESITATRRKTRRSMSVEPNDSAQHVSEPTENINISKTSSPEKDKATILNIPKEAFLTMPPISTPKRKSPMTKVSSSSRKPARGSLSLSESTSEQLPATPSRAKPLRIPASPLTPSRRSTRKSLALQVLNETPLETISEAQEIEEHRSPVEARVRSTRSSARKDSSTDSTASVQSPDIEYNLIKVASEQSSKRSSVQLSQKRKRKTERLTMLKMPLPLDETSSEEEESSKKRRTTRAEKLSEASSSSNTDDKPQKEESNKKPVRKSTRKSTRK